MFKGLGRGAIALIISGFVCKFFGALFRLPLTSILGMEGIGVFQMVISLYSLALVFVTGGVTNALAHLVSAARARGEGGKIYGYFKMASILTGVLSLTIGVCFFVLSGAISQVQGVSEGQLSYKLFLILIPVGGFIGVLRGVIQGQENMLPTAISQILEQAIKLGLGLLLAYLFSQKSIASGVFGGFLGITISEVIAFAYLAIYSLCKLKFVKTADKAQFPVLINAIVPLSLANAVIPLTHAFDALIFVSRLVKAGFSKQLATSLFGLQTGVVGAILNFPLIISLSLATSLLPKISYFASKQDEENQKRLIENSFAAMWTIILPLTFGLVAISRNLYPLIYSNTIGGLLDQAVQLTAIGGISIILTAIMQFLLSILQAQGLFVYTFFASLMGGIAKILIVFSLSGVQSVNVFALPLSNIALAAIICLLLLIKVGRLVKISAFCVLTPLLASSIMFIFVRLVASAPLSNIWIVAIGVVVGMIVYFVAAFPILKSLYLLFFGKNSAKEKQNE